MANPTYGIGNMYQVNALAGQARGMAEAQRMQMIWDQQRQENEYRRQQAAQEAAQQQSNWQAQQDRMNEQFNIQQTGMMPGGQPTLAYQQMKEAQSRNDALQRGMVPDESGTMVPTLAREQMMANEKRYADEIAMRGQIAGANAWGHLAAIPGQVAGGINNLGRLYETIRHNKTQETLQGQRLGKIKYPDLEEAQALATNHVAANPQLFDTVSQETRAKLEPIYNAKLAEELSGMSQPGSTDVWLREALKTGTQPEGQGWLGGAMSYIGAHEFGNLGKLLSAPGEYVGSGTLTGENVMQKFQNKYGADYNYLRMNSNPTADEKKRYEGLRIKFQKVQAGLDPDTGISGSNAVSGWQHISDAFNPFLLGQDKGYATVGDLWREVSGPIILNSVLSERLGDVN